MVVEFISMFGTRKYGDNMQTTDAKKEDIKNYTA